MTELRMEWMIKASIDVYGLSAFACKASNFNIIARFRCWKSDPHLQNGSRLCKLIIVFLAR